MNKLQISAFVLGAAVSFTAASQSQLNLQSRAILRMERAKQHLRVDPATKSIKRIANKSTHVTGLIRLADGASASDLEAEGITVFNVRGNIALASMPLNDVERLSGLKCVKSLELSREVSQKMDFVRAVSGIDKIHNGTDLGQAYTGKGVVAGIVDGGMDPNHINFKKEDGTSRIPYLTHIYADSKNPNGFTVDEYKTEEKLAKFATDDASTFHGTHTMGIMAGGYKGKGTFAAASGKSFTLGEMNNPYYGVAYDADIVASCGTLSDMLIAYGIEGILDYSYKTKKPAVVNLSLGSNTGPHDGTNTMSQYLDLAAKEAIFCVAAGNEGDMPIVLTKKFTASDTETKTFLYPTYEQEGLHNLRYGQVYIYSNDGTEFEVQAVIFNKRRGTITFRHAVSRNTEGSATYYSAGTNPLTGDSFVSDGDLSHNNFTNAFNGYVGIGSMIDENSGRYYALIDFFTSDNTKTNADGNYILGFIVKGKDGQRIDCYGDGQFNTFNNYDIAGWDKGTSDGTVSDMACAKNVIVVGSYNTRESWASLDGYEYGYRGTLPVGKVTSFSSWGTLLDGRSLPTVCAPGATVISSSSTYYIENTSLGIGSDYIQGKYKGTGRNNYWHQCVGTSMATPVVAGSIALWLEADPTLTTADIKDIIAKTSLVDDDVKAGNRVQWGAGKFDAYAGLKEVIRRKAEGVSDVTANGNKLIVTSADGRNYNLFLGGAQRMDAVIYNLAGQAVAHYSENADEMNIDASGLAAGYYIINVNGTQSQRIIVK